MTRDPEKQVWRTRDSGRVVDASQRQAAQQQHRIDTNLLTLDCQPTSTEAGRSEIGQAFRECGQILATSTAGMIRAFAFLVPLLIVFGAVFAAWRWRSRARKSKG